MLERLLGGFAAWAGAVVLLVAGLALALGLQGLRWRWPSWRGDPQRWSLRLLARLGVRPQPADTFSRLCARAAHRHPALADHWQAIADHQRRWAHAPLTAEQRRLEQRQWRRQLQILQRQIADP